MNDIIYYVQAYRVVRDIISLENHSYVVGVFTDSLLAQKIAEEEEMERGGKYQCVVYQGVMNEGLHHTSWENEGGDKITLMDLLNSTKHIPVENIFVEELKPHLLTWDDDGDEVKKIDSTELQYPILIFVNDDGEFISIIDGHHRAQKAVRNGLETIKAKVIPINSLPKDIRKVFSHMNEYLR